MNHFMQEALAQARVAYAKEEVPVGAIVVYQNQVIARAFNNVEAFRDPLAHAEVLAIREAARALGDARLPECDLYVTLEPCPMCAYALSLARIRRLYFGAYDVKGGGVENGPRIFNSSSCHHKPEVYGGIAEKEAQELLVRFFKERR